MIAVFALKSDFLNFVKSRDDARNYKLVTENIMKEFCGHNVTDVLFIGNFHDTYNNLEKLATKLKPYVGGKDSEIATYKLNQVIKIDVEIKKIKKEFFNKVL
jgi:hypothetical protein